jgi:hypothetical protein
MKLPVPLRRPPQIWLAQAKQPESEKPESEIGTD